MYDFRCVRSSDLLLCPDAHKLPLAVIELYLHLYRLNVSALYIQGSPVTVLTLFIKDDHCVYSTIDPLGAVEPVEDVMSITLLPEVVDQEY